MNTVAKRNDVRAEQIVCLLRDLAQRLVKGSGVDSEDVRRQLHAINRAARQVLVARRTASEVGPKANLTGVMRNSDCPANR